MASIDEIRENMTKVRALLVDHIIILTDQVDAGDDRLVETAAEILMDCVTLQRNARDIYDYEQWQYEQGRNGPGGNSYR